MQLNLFFHALAMLCSLASVVFAAVKVDRRGYVALIAGFVAAAAGTGLERLPDPVWVGGATAAVAVVALMRPRDELVLAASAGALAGVWLSMLWVAGLLPLPAAAAVAVVPPLLAVFFSSRDPKFAPPLLRDEAMLAVIVLAVVVAVAPGVAAGWQSAMTLNLQQSEAASQAMPPWTLLLTLGAAAAGGLYTVWTRR